MQENNKKLVIIHSDLSKLGLYKPKNQNILEDIKEILSQKIIAVPAYTINSFTKTKVYRPESDRSEVGALGELAKRMGWSRTNNPMHSFYLDDDTAYKDHTRFKDKIKTSSFGTKSFLAKVEQDAVILQIGCFHNTFVHRAENIFKVDYRYTKVFKGKWISLCDQGEVENEMIVRDLSIKGINEIDRKNAAVEFFNSKYSSEVKINDCTIRAFDADNYLKFTIKNLERNKYYLTSI